MPLAVLPPATVVRSPPGLPAPLDPQTAPSASRSDLKYAQIDTTEEETENKLYFTKYTTFIAYFLFKILSLVKTTNTIFIQSATFSQRLII